MTQVVTSLTPVTDPGSTNPTPLELTFSRPSLGNDKTYTLYFCANKEGVNNLDVANIQFDGSTASVIAITASYKVESVNESQWFFVRNITSGSHTISVPGTGSDIRRLIAGAVLSTSGNRKCSPVLASTVVNSAVSGTSVTASSIPVAVDDVVLSLANEGEVGAHTWSGGAIELTDNDGISFGVTVASQTIVTAGTVSHTCTSDVNNPINRLIISSIVSRETSATLIGNSWRKDLFNPIDRNLTLLGSVDWRHFARSVQFINNVHLKDAVTGTPGTGPSGWTATASGGTLTDGTSSQPYNTGVKTIGLSVTTQRHYFTRVSTNDDHATATTYYYSILATVNSGTITFQDLINVTAGTSTPTITSRAIDGVSAAAGDSVTGTLRELRIGYTVGSIGNVNYLWGVGVNANVTADCNLERPMASIQTSRESWPTVGDRKLGGALIEPHQKVNGAEGTVFWFPGDVTQSPLGVWTDGTVNLSTSDRDVTYTDVIVAGHGLKFNSAPLGTGRYRFVFGWSGYQSDMTLTVSVSDASSSNYVVTDNVGAGLVNSWETSVVVEVTSVSAFLTVALTAGDTDGNVGFQYAYVEDFPYELVIEDTFTDTNATNATAHTIAPVNTVSASYALVATAGVDADPTGNGGVTIESNSLQFATSDVSVSLEIGREDAIVEVTWGINGSTGHRISISPAFIAKDQQFWHNLREVQDDYTAYREDVGPSQVVLSGPTSLTMAVSTSYYVRSRSVGNSFILEFQGGTLNSHSPVTQYKNATKVKIGAATLGTPTKFDNLRVWRRISKPKITFNSTGMR